MNSISWIVLLVMAVWFGAAIRFMHKHKNTKSCGGSCNGDCQNCGSHKS